MVKPRAVWVRFARHVRSCAGGEHEPLGSSEVMKSLIKGWVSRCLAWRSRVGMEARFDRCRREGTDPFHVYPKGDLTLADARKRLRTGHFLVPNVSGFYHGILTEWFRVYGLGRRSLLVSETRAVAAAFSRAHPETEFVSTDFFVDLQPDPMCHVVWDLCSEEAPKELTGFGSIICQATLEHVADPVRVLRHFSTMLDEGGLLYIQTHTPSFHYHPYPRDYLRYHPDWFTDVPKIVRCLTLVELLCVDGHAFAVYRRSSGNTAQS